MLEEAMIFIRTNIGPLIALASAAIAWVALKANHDWNRRNCALQILSDWNAKTAPHRRIIEEIFPELMDKNKKSDYETEITKEMARKIYASKTVKKSAEGETESPEDIESNNYWRAKFHFMELGNHMECISAAYIHNVADRKMIETALKAPMTRWHKAMANYISEIQEHRGYNPWQPWDELIKKWNDEPKGFLRKKTA